MNNQDKEQAMEKYPRKNTINNQWLKITIQTDPRLVEPISDFLVGVIEAGVETGAPGDQLYGTVNGYLQQANLSQEQTDEIISRVSSYLTELAAIFNVATPSLVATVFDEEDWGKNWKEHFKPFTIVPGLVIAPSWDEYLPEEGESVITMDPGMAFGTGHHATTSLSLDFIRKVLLDKGGQQLLDVGTGTGILGMAALLFGAKSVLGLDNDPEAVSAAEENVRSNGLQDRMEVSLRPLASLSKPYGIVAANIVHDVLINMADDLARLTADGGTIILSGILVGEQVDNITAIFTAKGLQLIGHESREEWAALRFVKG